MQEIGSIYVGDCQKLMGGGIEAMTYRITVLSAGRGLADDYRREAPRGG